MQGIVQDKNGKTVATLFGKWDDSMHYVNGDGSRNGKPSEPHLLWKRSKPSKYQTRYNLTRFAITLNELTPGLKVGNDGKQYYYHSFYNSTQCLASSHLFLTFHLLQLWTEASLLLLALTFYKQEKLPPTDSRLRPDQRCLENGQYEMANAEKLRLEQRQRQVKMHVWTSFVLYTCIH